MIEVVLILVAMLLVLIAIPIVYFLAKKIGHGLKHVFFTAIICVMLTSMIQLGIFYFIMRFKVFVYLCKYGADCNSLFSSFVNISLYSSLAIFAFIISIYYLFKFLKGILKWGVIIFGIVLIIVAGVLVFNMFMPSTNKIMPNTSLCISNEDCIVIQEQGNASAMNKKYIQGRLEDIPNSLNSSLTCKYYPICIDKKCDVELRENSSVCEI